MIETLDVVSDRRKAKTRVGPSCRLAQSSCASTAGTAGTAGQCLSAGGSRYYRGNIGHL